jgi:hypothetical protein
MPRSTSRTTALMALARALRAGPGSTEPGIGERLRALPRLVRATLSGQYSGTTRGRLVLLVVGLLYVLSPVDLIPELFLPLVGLADDAVVVTWLAGRVLAETADFLDWERGAGGGSTPIIHE